MTASRMPRQPAAPPTDRVIASAIIAERERSAEVCRSEAKAAKKDGFTREAAGALWCATVIIRKGT
jgi:hypothetical protein